MKDVRLIIIGGFAGAGKTTVAKRLSAAYGLPLFGTDALNDVLRAFLHIDFKQASPLAHETAWSLVRSHLKNDVSVILDANMCHDRTWENVDGIARTFPHVRVLPFILECPLDTHRTRIEQRGRTEPDHLNLGGDAFEDVLPKYDYIRNLRRDDLLRVDADRPLDAVIADIETFLFKGIPPILGHTPL